MGGHVRLPRIVSGVAVAAMALTLIVSAASPSFGCSCAALSIAEKSDYADIVFVGRQVAYGDRTTPPPADGGDEGYPRPIQITLEVEEVLKGDAPHEVTVFTGLGGGDCGIGSLERFGSVAIFLTEGRGEYTVGVCGSIDDATAVHAHFRGVPAPATDGPPVFAVAGNLGDTRVAFLDAAGRVTGYGRGEGAVVAMAVCPGTGNLVEVVQPIPDSSGELEGGPRLDVRSLDTLEVVSSRTIGGVSRDDMLGRRDWVLDLECHDAAGDTVSYLLAAYEWDALAAADLTADGAVVHVRRGSEVTEVEVGAVKALTVDVDSDRMYLVRGLRGHHLDVRDLEGDLVQSDDLPGGSAAWDVALVEGGSTLMVVARWTAPSDDELSWPEVDRLLIRRVDATEYATIELPESGALSGFAATEAGVWMTLFLPDDEASAFTTTEVDASGALGQSLLIERDGVPLELAMAGETALVHGWFGDEPGRPVWIATRDGELVRVEGALAPGVNAVAAVGRQRSGEVDGGAGILPDPASASTATTETVAAPPTDAPDPSVAGTPPGAAEDDAVAGGESGRSDRTAVVVAVVFGLLGLLIALVLAPRRKRRTAPPPG